MPNGVCGAGTLAEYSYKVLEPGSVQCGVHKKFTPQPTQCVVNPATGK